MTTLVPLDLTAFLALAARGAAFMTAAPVVGDRVVSGKARGAAALIVALGCSGVHADRPHADLWIAVPIEAVFGFVGGFIARIIVAAGEVAGELMGVHMGLGFAASYDPSLGESALPLRRIAAALGGLAFVQVGGVEAIGHFVALPPPDLTQLLFLDLLIIERSQDVLVVGFRLAAPIVVGVFTANIAMGLAARAAPALNVFSVMLAITLLIGGFELFATAPEFVRALEELALEAVRVPLEGGLP